jgi:hypothetical protein
MDMKNIKLLLWLFKCGKGEQRTSINTVQPLTNSVVKSRWLFRWLQNYPLLWNLKVHYCVHKCPALGHIPSLLNPAHILTPHCFKILLNSILHLCLGLSRCLFSSGSTTNIWYTFLNSPNMLHVHPTLLHLIILIIFNEEHKLRSSSLLLH